ncbi:unnamed protein product [Thelazia callipaeda]|uniref:BACK domain-containing protein n=1 Tax=Thelazia callipaeda TaxID=103827 RepID=A0A0N5D5P1_THECL|nr:unnamed protein product [Thelazia callipaeda]
MKFCSDMTEHISSRPFPKSDIVILRTRRRNYPIKIENFANCSDKIALLVKRGQVPAAIDLSCYNIGAVRTLTDFVAGVDRRNLRLGDNILKDLLQLARIFRMQEFTTLIVEHIVDKVEKGPASNLLLALNLISSDWSMFLHFNEASALVESAVENICEVTLSTFFYSLPAAVLAILYNRCDVGISSEIELCLRFIRWLKKAARTNDDAEVLFSCVRSAFLSSKDREIIKDKYIGLPKIMAILIEQTLDSPRNHRCCVIRDHIERHYPRCGIPESNRYFKINLIDIIYKPLQKLNNK